MQLAINHFSLAFLVFSCRLISRISRLAFSFVFGARRLSGVAGRGGVEILMQHTFNLPALLKAEARTSRWHRAERSLLADATPSHRLYHVSPSRLSFLHSTFLFLFFPPHQRSFLISGMEIILISFSSGDAVAGPGRARRVGTRPLLASAWSEWRSFVTAVPLFLTQFGWHGRTWTLGEHRMLLKAPDPLAEVKN